MYKRKIVKKVKQAVKEDPLIKLLKSENRRLQRRVVYLENQLSMMLQDYRNDLRELLNGNEYEEDIPELNKQIALPSSTPYDKTVHPFNMRRTTNDLMKKARKDHESEQLKLAVERQKRERDTDEPKVEVSETKQSYYISKAKQLVKQ